MAFGTCLFLDLGSSLYLSRYHFQIFLLHPTFPLSISLPPRKKISLSFLAGPPSRTFFLTPQVVTNVKLLFQNRSQSYKIASVLKETALVLNYYISSI